MVKRHGDVTVTPSDTDSESDSDTELKQRNKKGATGLKMSPVDRPLPEQLRNNWVQAYQFWFVNPPTPIYLSDMERLQNRAGITDPLIVAVIERAIQTKRLNIMAWVRTVLGEMVPYGITTPEQWLAFEAERQAEEERARATPTRTSGQHRKSNVFLQRDSPRAGDYYDYIEDKFRDPPEPEEVKS